MAKRLINLDILRFALCLGIMFYHYFFIGPIQGFYSKEVFINFAFFGEFGVDLFFIISGFSILYSVQNKTLKQYTIRRILRLYPTIFICSSFTLLTGIFMPDTSIKDLLTRWGFQFTFFNDLFGVNYISTLYWTMNLTVHFYILVGIIKATGWWNNNKYYILYAWLSLYFLNTFIIKNQIIESLFVTRYSGHFILGILLFLFIKKERDILMLPLGIGSIWCIYQHCEDYASWIRGIYNGFIFSNVTIFIAVILMLCILLLCVKKIESPFNPDVAKLLGALSFTFFLIHADLGYFIRTQYYTRITIWFPKISQYINEWFLMGIGIFSSLLVAYLFYLISAKFTGFLKTCFVK